MSLGVEELKERVIKAKQAYDAAKAALYAATRNAFAIRKCRRCKRQIRSGHKWHFVTEKGVTMTEHRTCKYPDSYSDEQGARFAKKWGRPG